MFTADDFLLPDGFAEKGLRDIVEGDFTNGQGHRNGYNLIDRSSVSSNFCGINKGL